MELQLVNWRLRSAGLLGVGLFGALLFGAGCMNHAARPAAAAGWKISLSASPTAPRQMDPAAFQVTIADRSGKPVTGAQVVLQLAMPEMAMGLNQTEAHAGVAGAYLATGRFTMPGSWQVTVQANKGSVHQSRIFPISVR